MIQIQPNLFVGDIQDARDESKIKQFAYVLSCTHSDPVVVPGVVYGRIAINDGTPWPEELKARAIGFIEEGLEKGKVLVHSDMGISRSVAAVVFWLASKGMSLKEAIEKVKSVFPNASPHPAIFGEVKLPAVKETKEVPEGDLSIVVVTWNRKDMHEKCISSILNNTPRPFELIVVDNGSTDGTVECLRKFEDVTLIELDKNYGKGVAANIGIKKAKGKWICYLDGDIILPKGWFEKVVSAYRSLENPGWITLPYEDTVLQSEYKVGEIYEMDSVDGGMVFAERSVWEDLGGFVEDKLYGGIDTEYVARARKKGLKVGYVDSDVRLVHLGKEDSPRYKAWKKLAIPFLKEPPPVPDTVEIIVVRYNLPDIERQCIDSVLEHTKWRYRLTVVDNYKRKERLGVLWNELIEKSKCRFICLLNSDCIVTDGWLERMVHTFSFDQRIAIVGPSTNMCATQQRIISELSPEDAHSFAEKVARDFRGQWTTSELSGFCYLLRKDVWEALGGFSPEFRFYGQESEFNWRVRRAGYWPVWRKDAFVYHIGRASADAAAKRGEFDYGFEVRYARETKKRLIGS